VWLSVMECARKNKKEKGMSGKKKKMKKETE
jgi:hypothetical protein